MRFSGVSTSAIWGATTRTITGFGTTALVLPLSINLTVAAASTVSFSQLSGKIQVMAVGCVADASGSIVIQFTDGTNTWTAVTVAAGTTGGQDVAITSSSVNWQIHNNSATVAGHYFTAGFLLSQ